MQPAVYRRLDRLRGRAISFSADFFGNRASGSIADRGKMVYDKSIKNCAKPIAWGYRKMTIDDLTIGQSGVISQVGGEGPLRLRFLDMGLIPGTKVTLQKIAPMGDPIQIQVRGYELTIRREDARKIALKEGTV